MRSARVWVSAAGVMGSVILMAASCGPRAEPVVTPAGPGTAKPPETATTSAAESTTTASTSAPATATPPKPAAWTDDDVVKKLAADCHWDPDGCLQAILKIMPNSINGIDFMPEGGLPAGDPRPLPPQKCQDWVSIACAQVPEQSCVPDECSHSDDECVPECDKSCDSCGQKCVAGCDQCKSGCKDDACKLSCAKSCAECRQSCLKALDHCTSAHCSEVQEACFKKQDDLWNKSTCPKACPKVQDCVEKCPDTPEAYFGERYQNACAKKCLQRLGRGCPEKFSTICAGDPNAGVNFYAYHNAHNKD